MSLATLLNITSGFNTTNATTEAPEEEEEESKKNVYKCEKARSIKEGVLDSLLNSYFCWKWAFWTARLEPVCCKKRPKIVPDQLLILETRALSRF